MRSQRSLLRATAALMIAVLAPDTIQAQGLPVVPGFNVEVYAQVCEPNGLVFDDAGFLFVGNGGCGVGNGDPAWVRRIGPGGSPIENYGESMITDPDNVGYDATGSITGFAGSILVGGSCVVAILPDESIISVFSSCGNTTGYAFDSTDRLAISILTNPPAVYVTTGDTPVVLFQLAAAGLRGLAIDDQDRIYTTSGDGTVRIHAPDGTLVDDSFVTGLGPESHLRFAQGGAFGENLYVAVRDSGQLLRVDSTGTPTVIGTGFTGRPVDLVFGPDGWLYVSEANKDRILRISPACSADVTDNGTVDLADLLDLLSAWGECDNCQEDLNSDGVVGFQDLLILLAAWGPCP